MNQKFKPKLIRKLDHKKDGCSNKKDGCSNKKLRYMLPPCQRFPLGEHPMGPSSSQALVLEIYISNIVELSDLIDY